jgi:alkylation response protein AidB-like acyl-CoA dehydrogenase
MASVSAAAPDAATLKALFELTDDLVEREVRPAAAAAEESGRFPREVFAAIGRAGLLGLPYPEAYGGGGLPYETYLQVVEKLAAGWLTIGLGVSVHTLACFPVAAHGDAAQRERWLPEMLGGDLLGAYCLSEAHSGSDAGAMSTRVARDADGYMINGVKAFITHGGEADFYTVFARTSGESQGPDRARGISCLHVPADVAGVSAAAPEHKMGMRASRTSQVIFEGARVAAGNLIGGEGSGFKIALEALDSGRLGIAACSTGLAQAALDVAVRYAGERRQFGTPIAEFQGLSFMLADMATAVEAARALYRAAARRKDAGEPFGRQAAMAKLFASDAAMRVTTDAVQVLGGYGYVTDFPAERYMREAKMLQIVEGTNQIQRLVISRALRRRSEDAPPNRHAAER